MADPRIPTTPAPQDATGDSGRWPNNQQRPSELRHHTAMPGDKPGPVTTVKPKRPAGRIAIVERIDPGPSSLVTVNERGEPPVGNEKKLHQLTQPALDAFLALRAAALAAGFRPNLFVLTSAYRSAAYQAGLAADAVTKYGDKQKAATWVAQGRSEHITGRAFDLFLGVPNNSENVAKFMSLPAWLWLKQHAGEFGLNEYTAEPWHWSYNVERR